MKCVKLLILCNKIVGEVDIYKILHLMDKWMDMIMKVMIKGNDQLRKILTISHVTFLVDFNRMILWTH